MPTFAPEAASGHRGLEGRGGLVWRLIMEVLWVTTIYEQL